ncbi:MAG: glycosyltransferase family 2 protein [Candidatus Neomarinimicrobiota bacterium]
MKEPFVYIVVLNWNGRDVTLRCLHSIQQLRYSNYATLVVDNGSQDGSVEAIKSQFPQLEVLSLPENRGNARGFNAGMEVGLGASPHWILFLNNDTEVAPDLLVELMRGVEKYPDGGVFSPKIYFGADDGLIWYAGGQVDFRLGRMRHRGIREQDRGQYDEPGQTQFVSGCCMLVRAELAHQLGGFDVTFTISRFKRSPGYGEDVDFCYRAQQQQAACYYLPAGKVWHYVSSSMGGELSLRKVLLKFLSTMRFFWRYGKPWHWPSILGYQVLYYGVLGPARYIKSRWL